MGRMTRHLLACLLALAPALASAQNNDDDDNEGALPAVPQQPQQGPPQQQRPPQQQPPYGYPPQQQNPYYQQPPPNYYPYGQQPYRYPTGQRYPQGQYPYNYQYPYGQYPYGQQYPYPQYRDQYGRPIPAPQQQPPGQPPMPGQNPGVASAPATPPQQPAVAFTITTTNDAARADALACADALENYHLDAARAKCTDALAKDADLALAHLWLAMASNSPSVAATELTKAGESAVKASAGERLMVGAYRAWREARVADARKLYDELCTTYSGEKRAFLRRGLFRQVALGDLDGAVADYRRAVALDDKYAVANNFLGFALADQGKQDEAAASLKKYAALAPNEPNALDSLASLALRNGDLGEAIADERKAINLDPKFLVAHAVLGDALLLQGKAKDARKEYAFLEAADDPALHHEGTLRSALSYLFENNSIEAEKALVREGAEARKGGRLAESAEAFLQVARIQVERGALAEAGRGLKEAKDSLARPSGAAAPPAVEEVERRRLQAELTQTRAMALAALYERELADARADEAGGQLKLAGDQHADERVKVLKVWIAFRAGDDKAALAALEKATLPSLRYAYALALARSGDMARARTIMDELARRNSVDLETALARPRAAAWLKGTPQPGASASR